jgi:hypothetical protein
MPTHPQVVPTSLSPAGTAGLFLLSGDAQVSCQIEGNSEDLSINDRAGIQIAALDSRLRGNDGVSSKPDGTEHENGIALNTSPGRSLTNALIDS